MGGYTLFMPQRLRLKDIVAMQNILHTGDMRWQPRLADHPALKACKVDLLYMDTTYSLPKHVFPSQVSVVRVPSHFFGLPAKLLVSCCFWCQSA